MFVQIVLKASLVWFWQRPNVFSISRYLTIVFDSWFFRFALMNLSPAVVFNMKRKWYIWSRRTGLSMSWIINLFSIIANQNIIQKMKPYRIYDLCILVALSLSLTGICVNTWIIRNKRYLISENIQIVFSSLMFINPRNDGKHQCEMALDNENGMLRKTSPLTIRFILHMSL